MACVQTLSMFPASKIPVPNILCLMMFSLNFPTHFFWGRMWVWFYHMHLCLDSTFILALYQLSSADLEAFLHN